MTGSYTYIDVAVALPVYNTFTYLVPENLLDLVSAGKRVLVPFGQRKVTGYVLGPCHNTQDQKIKCILDVLDERPLFPASMISFFRWVANYYMHPIGEVINGALPGGLNLYDFSVVTITKKGERALQGKSITPLERDVLNALEKTCCLKDLYKKLHKNIPNALIHKMESRGLVVKTREIKGGTTRPKMERHIALNTSELSINSLSESKNKIIEIAKSEGEISVKKLKKLVPKAPGLINSLEKAGYIKIFKKSVYRDPFGDPIEPDIPPSLSEEQKKVVSKISDCFGKGFATFLLSGVTGSGKTEVYMQVAANSIKLGYSVLILVPEIALISQMERRFRARFGDCIAVLHSSLSEGERYDQWMRIIRQEAKIVVGARSAIFAPFENIGIIIVDEEHDTSYKQEGSFRYNARDMAIVRSKFCGGITLLGSATPSVQSHFNVITNKYIGLNLKTRVNKQPLPEITVVDLRNQKNINKVQGFITAELHTAMKETLERGEQIILFLNRRGFASFPVCAACGEAVRCKNCDISLTLHQDANAYKCHFCGFSQASVAKCRGCGSSNIKLLGLGTEKVEMAVKTLFPDARVGRMDRDTTTRKGSMLKILKSLKDHTIDILVGTQMVVKGHDFPNITLVGIICADLSLNFPDFRAGERTFQILAQVSGRAGRGALPGRAIMQTFHPAHYSITSARTQDFMAFFKKEIDFRKALNYPPYTRMVQLKISGKDKGKTSLHAQAIGNMCKALQGDISHFFKSVEVLGPIESAMPRIAKRFRWQILLKASAAEPLHRFVQELKKNRSLFNNRNINVAVDVDPFFMM